MHTKFIAELGQNLCGSHLLKSNALMYLTRASAIAGASWIKLQLYDSRRVFTGEESFYQDTVFAELTQSQADFWVQALKAINSDAEVIEARKKLGLPDAKPLFSVFDPGRLSWAIESLSHWFPELPEIDIKIASRTASDAKTLTACKGFKNAKNQYRNNERMYRPLHGIISHGMKVFTNEDYARYFDRQTHLFCRSQYPCVYSQEDWAQFEQGLKDGVYQGISDHALGIDSVAHAIELANNAGNIDTFFVEKHCTIAKNFAGPDHRLSCTPYELSQLVTKYG